MTKNGGESMRLVSQRSWLPVELMQQSDTLHKLNVKGLMQ
jgi:hypothetical protein